MIVKKCEKPKAFSLRSFNRMPGFWQKSFFEDKKQLLESSFFLYDFVLLLRLIFPPLIWLAPISVTIAAFFLDVIDYEVFRICSALRSGEKYNYFGLVKINYDFYHVFDKALDFYWFFFALLYSFRFKIFGLLLALFIWRLLGMIFFIITNNRRIFILFGNYFENVFIFYLLALNISSWNYLLEGNYFIFSLMILFFLKFVQEYFIHLSGYSTTYRYLLTQRLKKFLKLKN